PVRAAAGGDRGDRGGDLPADQLLCARRADLRAALELVRDRRHGDPLVSRVQAAGPSGRGALALSRAMGEHASAFSWGFPATQRDRSRAKWLKQKPSSSTEEGWVVVWPLKRRRPRIGNEPSGARHPSLARTPPPLPLLS